MGGLGARIHKMHRLIQLRGSQSCCTFGCRLSSLVLRAQILCPMHKRTRSDVEGTDEAADTKRRRSSVWGYLGYPLSKLSSWMRPSGKMRDGVDPQACVEDIDAVDKSAPAMPCPSSANSGVPTPVCNQEAPGMNALPLAKPTAPTGACDEKAPAMPCPTSAKPAAATWTCDAGLAFHTLRAPRARSPVAQPQRRVIPRPPPPAAAGVGGLDVCFVMDCTSSMAPWIRAAKQTIKDMIAELPPAEPHKRIAFVGYRDLGDGPAHVHPFTEDASAVIGAIEAEVASGGADPPEDVAGALADALGLKWASQARTVVLIADAPCHGKGYHALGDDHPAGDPTGLSMSGLLWAFRNAHIDFTFVQLTSDTDKMQGRLKAVYESAAGPDNIGKFELRDLRGIIQKVGGHAAIGRGGRAREVTAMLSSAVSPSVRASYVTHSSGVQTYSPCVGASYAAYTSSRNADAHNTRP